MNYTREHANNAKTYLSAAYEKISKTFEGIETPAHYNVFYNMCNNVLTYCKVWDERLKPKCKLLQKSAWEVYESYGEYAMNTIAKLNEMIDEYTSAEAVANEYAKKYAETEERMRIERDIIDKLNKEKEEEIKHESNPIGFVQQISQKKKRKYTRKKINEA